MILTLDLFFLAALVLQKFKLEEFPVTLHRLNPRVLRELNSEVQKSFLPSCGLLQGGQGPPVPSGTLDGIRNRIFLHVFGSAHRVCAKQGTICNNNNNNNMNNALQADLTAFWSKQFSHPGCFTVKLKLHSATIQTHQRSHQPSRGIPG